MGVVGEYILCMLEFRHTSVLVLEVSRAMCKNALYNASVVLLML